MTDPRSHRPRAQAFSVAAAITMTTLFATGAQAFDTQSMDKLTAEDECPKCDLSKTDLSGGAFPGGDFSDANLSGSNLEGVVMNEATLEGADLGGADLTDAILEGATLTGADLTGATLTRTDLSGADLSGVTGLTQEQLDETCDDGSDDPATVTLPDGLVLERCE